MVDNIVMTVTLKGFGRTENISQKQHWDSVSQLVERKLYESLGLNSKDDVSVKSSLEDTSG